MDDLGERLAAVLNDPQMLSELQSMAKGLLGGADDSKTKNSAQSTADFSSTFEEGGIDPIQMANIMGIISQLKARGNDDRSQLLLALKPHLSAPRREKVDTALKLLKIIDLLPVLKDSGLLNL